MGGLAPRMRWTHLAFLSGSLALAGIPIFSGWFSKENLLGFGTVAGPGGFPWLLYIVGVGINVLTGLYAFRLWAKVFHGEPQTARVYAAKEPGRSMLVPVGILAALALVVAWPLQWPIPHTLHVFSDFLSPVFTSASGGLAVEPKIGIALVALIVGTLASLIGAGAAFRIWYERRPDAGDVVNVLPPVLRPAYHRVALLSYNKFYFDELYDAAFVRPTRAAGSALRRVVEPGVMDGWIRGLTEIMRGFSVDLRTYQTGLIRDYASLFAVFAVIFVVITIVFVAR
jgi:NADH-quinone oxidoreductase subunit L